MDMEYPEFGTIIIDGTSYNHDVVVDAGLVRKRKKGPSKRFRSEYGHTPLSAGEDIPWTKPRLVIGTGFSGRLPVMQELRHRADRRRLRSAPHARRLRRQRHPACDVLTGCRHGRK
jgi:hypothetical protein